MKMYHTFLCCYQHAPTEFLVAPSKCFGTPRTCFEYVPWFVSFHLCEHSHRFDHRHYIIYPRNKWPLRLSYFYVTVITLFWQQNVTVILTQKFLSVLCRSWAPICHKKITVNVTYVITQYTFATTHIYALINENPQVTTRTVTGSRHVLITVTAVTVILIRHSDNTNLMYSYLGIPGPCFR